MIIQIGPGVFVERRLPDMAACWMGQFRMRVQKRMPLARERRGILYDAHLSSAALYRLNPAPFPFKGIRWQSDTTARDILYDAPTPLKAGPIHLCTFNIQGSDRM